MSSLLLAAACASASADTNSSWALRVWQSDTGLPNDNITGIDQTPDGHLWIANQSRLARFDGAQFDGIPSSHIHSNFPGRISTVLCSRDGSLWMNIDHGPIVALRDGVVTIISNNVPDLVPRKMLEDTEGSIWMVYHENAVARIRNGEVKLFKERDGWGPAPGCSLSVESCGRIWFSRGNLVGVFRNERFETLHTLAHQRTRVLASRRGGVWICSGYQVFKCDEQNGLTEIGRFAPDPANAGPIDLLEDRTGALWIGTSGRGLYRYDGSGFQKVHTSHSRIHALFEDREGNIWVGTGGGGLNRLCRQAVELESMEQGLPYETAQSLCEDKDGNLWAVAGNGQLAMRGGSGAWRTISTNAGWPDQTMSCVAANSTGVWVGTADRTLHLLQGNKRTAWGKDEGLLIQNISALLPRKNGDVWIVGDSPAKLQRFRNGQFAQFKVPPNSARISTIAEDVAGNIWLGSSKGVLLRITNDELFDETGKYGPPKSIRVLHGAPDGSLLIGHAGAGLGRLKDGKLFRLNNYHGLHDNHISQIVTDRTGWIWCGGDRGIFKIWSGVVADVAEGRDTGLQCIHYGRGEGLPSLQAYYGYGPGSMLARDGRVWIPMRTAIAVINPSRLSEDTNAPNVLLRHVSVDDQTEAIYGGVLPVRMGIDLQKPGAHLKLKPGHHRLHFQFTALSLRSPENVQFRYKLEGMDVDWVWVGTQRSATYSRLPAGDYTFRVAACNGDGFWNEKGYALAVTVLPFMWQTWWFRLGTILVFTLTVAAVVRYVSFRRLRRRLQIAQRQAALDKERARIARDIHDDVGSRLTKIVLLNELTLQQEESTPEVRERAEQTANAARQVRKSLDEAIWAINSRNDTLRDLADYMGQFALDFLTAAKIRCRIEVPEDLPERPLAADVRHNLFLASKEVLNNIVQHSQATEAELRLETQNGSLHVSIRDNGRGFDGQPGHASADGLRNMRQRLEEIGGEFEMESRPGAGTKVSFCYHWPAENN